MAQKGSCKADKKKSDGAATLSKEDVIKLIGSRYARLHFAARQKKSVTKKEITALQFGLAHVMGVLSIAVSAKTGKPVNLIKLANSSNKDLIHDVMGCSTAFDPKTSTFKKGFEPRCGFEA